MSLDKAYKICLEKLVRNFERSERRISLNARNLHRPTGYVVLDQ